MSRKLFKMRGRWSAAAAVAAVALFGIVFLAGSAFGGPSPSSFQLDGDAITQAATPGDDWDKVLNHTGSGFSSVFIPYSSEGPATDGTAWTPGTKAIDDISSWSWQSNTSVINAKADITDSFAAAYKSGARTLMYFGLDRFDESGDANVGFWFLQDPTFKLNADGSFSGHHQEGDVFIQSQFLNGGGIANPVEFTWHNGALTQVQTGTVCTSQEQSLCAIDNDGTGGRPGAITVPWRYQDKDGNPAGTIEPNGFFEGGFDIGSLFQGGDLPCFTHFVAQTGTSGTGGNSETLKDLAAGDVQSCGTIQLEKHWVGTPDSATLKVGKTDGAGDVASKTVTTDGSTDEVEAKAGTYFVSESLANAGSFTSSLACFNDQNHDGTQQGGEPVVSFSPTAQGASVNLGVGDHIVCTYTNTRKPHLTLQKVVTNNNGGTATAAQWTLSAAANGDSNSFSGLGPAQQHDVTAGVAYALAESNGPIGYTPSAWSCDGGTQNGASIALSAGQNVTCTITNDDIQPKLIVIKHVVNDNGGTAVSSDFAMNVTGGSPNPASSPGADSPGTQVSLNAGSYSVGETGPSGYASSLSSDCSGTIAVGETKTCTVTNDDIRPKLVVIKHVINNDGGTAVASDFTMNVTGGSPSPASSKGAESPGTNVSLNAGSYSVGETGPSGYASSLSADCSGTIAVGETKTCTVTNDDSPATLVVIKHVVNDNGGTASAGDFTMHVTGSSPSPAGFSGAESPGTQVAISPGTYSVGESGPGGYTPSLSSDCAGTIVLGQTKTCTVTNDDLAPTITVNKVVVPSTDQGTFDFTLTQGEAKSVLDNSGTGYGNGQSTGAVDVSAGDLTVGESGHGSTGGSHYSSQWSCSSDTQRSANGTGTSIPLGGLKLGEHVTCTFTNTRLATLIVKKVVDNTNGGGSKTPADFKITVAGVGSAPGSSTGTTYGDLAPGTYTVSEDAVSGYSLTKTEGCAANGTITLNPGETATCTLTNTSAAPPPPPATPPAPPAPPAPKVDIQITKSATPNPVTVGKQVTWTMVVTNNGPNNATGVTVADPVPAGMTFGSATSSQGTCTGGALVSCQLGNLNVGASVTITLVTTASSTGMITNTATTVANEQETNTANNTASASVLVNGPFVPPVAFCTAVAVSPKQLLAGRSNTLNLRISQHGKVKAGVKVRVKGSTLRLTTRPSNGKGVIKQRIKPMKAGIVVFTPVAAKSCKNPRIGVIGVFTPPVTG